MNKIIAKIENFNNKLNAMFNDKEPLVFDSDNQYGYEYDLAFEELEEFKKSFTEEEIQKLKDLYFKKLFVDGDTLFFYDLLKFLEEDREIQNTWVYKTLNYINESDLGNELITLWWDDNAVNLTFALEELKKYDYFI